VENQVNQMPIIAPKGIWARICYHPNFGVIVGMIGVVTGIFGVYAYYASIQKPDLTYYISPTRTPLVQKGHLRGFDVKLNGIQVEGDLSSAEIQFWNQGKAPIRHEDILKPISITTKSGGEILEASYYTTRDAIELNTEFPLKGYVVLGRADDFVNKTAKFDWNILEQNDGVKVQLVYAGSVSEPILVDGVIAGQKQLTHYTFGTTPFYKRVIGTIFIFGSYGVVLSGIMFLVAMSQKKRSLKVSFYGLIGIILLLLALFLAQHFQDTVILAPTKPPFGF
jgi:hypothetical protein